ncbi:MAG: MlaD family protein [Cyanobacteriota bacterium]|jgi:phospholipid/cholesterol/gamma-HCH transport system substrate-binding protein
MSDPTPESPPTTPLLWQSAVGLLFLVSLFGLVALLVWLRDLPLTRRGYHLTFLFKDATGIVTGTRVNYRGVRIGQVTRLMPRPAEVAIEVEITETGDPIPSQARIEALPISLIGEMSLNIVPTVAALPTNLKASPWEKPCPEQVILCDGAVLRGDEIIDTNRLLRSALRLTKLLDNPQVIQALGEITEQTPDLLDDVSALSRDGRQLLGEVKNTQVLSNLKRTLTRLDRTLGQVDSLSSEAITLSSEVTQTLGELRREGLIEDLDATLVLASRLGRQVETLIQGNEKRLGTTLDSVQTLSADLQGLLKTLNPPLRSLLVNLDNPQTQAEIQTLLANLQTLTANAKDISQNLTGVSAQLSQPETLLLLQQLLDSARTSLQNLEKISADIEQLTGNPALRDDLRRLLRGLSQLLSAGQSLEREIQTQGTLEHLAQALRPLKPLKSRE